MTRFDVGDRVELSRDVDNFPNVYARAGERSTVVNVEHDSTWVRMDRTFPELAEWNNELQIWHPRDEAVEDLPLQRIEP